MQHIWVAEPPAWCPPVFLVCRDPLWITFLGLFCGSAAAVGAVEPPTNARPVLNVYDCVCVCVWFACVSLQACVNGWKCCLHIHACVYTIHAGPTAMHAALRSSSGVELLSEQGHQVLFKLCGTQLPRLSVCKLCSRRGCTTHTRRSRGDLKSTSASYTSKR